MLFLIFYSLCAWQWWQPKHSLGFGDLLARCCEGCFSKVKDNLL